MSLLPMLAEIIGIALAIFLGGCAITWAMVCVVAWPVWKAERREREGCE